MSQALLKQFEEQLKKHDWFYEMTDDGRVWQRGRESESKVNGSLSMLDQVVTRAELKEVWERAVPKEFKFPLELK